MAKKVFNMQGGLHSAAAYSAFENRLNGSVKASPDSFIVSAGAGMNASISTGDGLISVDNFNARRIQTTAAEAVTVPAANASFNRIDSVVAYIDSTVVPTTAVVDNVNDILKFMVVAGTAAATPAAPTSAAIQAAIGVGNPYMILATITLPAAATNLAGATFDNIAPTPLLKHYPVGAVYISVTNTSPQTLFGGKWVAFAAGRTLVGVDAGQTEFDTVEETGGAKTHTLTTAEMPNHNHTIDATLIKYVGGGGTQNWNMAAGTTAAERSATLFTGGGGAHNNLQPYIVTYMWKRTA